MSARDDNNFLEMLRALPAQGWVRATPRDVTFTPADVARCEAVRSRRKQGLPAKIRDARRVVSILTGSK